MMRRLLCLAVAGVLLAPASAFAALPDPADCYNLYPVGGSPAANSGYTWGGGGSKDYPIQFADDKWAYVPSGYTSSNIHNATISSGYDGGIGTHSFSWVVNAPTAAGEKKLIVMKVRDDFFRVSGVELMWRWMSYSAKANVNNADRGVASYTGSTPYEMFNYRLGVSGVNDGSRSFPWALEDTNGIAVTVIAVGFWKDGATLRYKYAVMSDVKVDGVGAHRSDEGTGTTGYTSATFAASCPDVFGHYQTANGGWDTGSAVGSVGQIQNNFYLVQTSDPAAFDSFWAGGAVTDLTYGEWITDAFKFGSLDQWTEDEGGGGGSIDVTIGVPPSVDDSETADLNDQLDGGGGNWVSNWIWGKVTGWLSPITSAWFWFLSLFSGL